MSQPSAQDLVPKFLQNSGRQWVIDRHGRTSTTMDNGRIFSYKHIAGTTLQGFVVHLEDPNHRLEPLFTFMRYIDDEKRLSAEMSLKLGDMPEALGWGKVSRDLHLRAYDVSVPWYREGDTEYADIINYGSREKIALTDNMNSVLPANQRRNLETWQSFKHRSDFSDDGIPDELWNPCWDFAVSAAQDMAGGEFPEFKNLQLPGKSFASNDEILAYSGPIKKCER